MVNIIFATWKKVVSYACSRDMINIVTCSTCIYFELERTLRFPDYVYSLYSSDRFRASPIGVDSAAIAVVK